MGRKKKLAYNKVAGQYTRAAGYYRAGNGKKIPRVFYLGTNLAEAEIKALEIEATWKKLKQQGYTEWPLAAEQDLVARGICQIKRSLLRKPSEDAPMPTLAEPSRSIINIDPALLRKRDEIKGWFDESGKLKHEHFVEFQKYAVTELLNCDPNTLTLLEQIQTLWNSDALTTLERIAKLGIGPNQLNLGLQVNTGSPIAWDASARIIDVKRAGDDVKDCD